jgi:Thiolase, C-terminal domain
VSRDEQDALAVESHRRAAAAVEAGTSPSRSSRSRYPAKRGPRPSTPTSTSGPASPEPTWPGSSRPSLRPARSPRGISLGHPIGATGAILTVKALYELRRTGGQYALVTMCIGGGQGIAAVFERI